MGDPNQLPATVLSAGALEHGYNTSMFQRLQAAGYPVQVQHVLRSVAADIACKEECNTCMYNCLQAAGCAKQRCSLTFFLSALP